MSEYIKSVQAIGVHGQFDFFCNFQEGVNIIYGKNGTGKTTLLHILANVVNRDFIRFAALNFKRITVVFSNNEHIQIDLIKRTVSDHYHADILVNGVKINTEEICSRKIIEKDADIDRSYTSEGHKKVIHHLPDGKITKKYHMIDENGQIIMDLIPDIPIKAAYFPSFRTAIDAWAVNASEDYYVTTGSQRRRTLHQGKKTAFARSLFGQFVPRLDYPATTEIEFELNERIRTALANVSKADRTFFGDVPSKILQSLSDTYDSDSDEETQVLLQDIESLSQRFQKYPLEFESMWSKLSKSVQSVPKDEKNKHITSIVLSAYKNALNSIVSIQEDSFQEIERYLESVNKFLENKNLEISSYGLTKSRAPAIVLCFEGQKPVLMSMSRAFSSGERQIVTLIYATTKMNQQDVVLIDEPEISLNVDWQRKLLPEMVGQMPSKQLIVCTHSPIIGARYRDRMMDLKAIATQNPEDIFVDEDDDFIDFDSELEI